MALFSRWTVSKLGLTFAGQSTSDRAKAFFDCALTFRTTTLPWIFPNLNCFADQSSEKKKGNFMVEYPARPVRLDGTPKTEKTIYPSFPCLLSSHQTHSLTRIKLMSCKPMYGLSMNSEMHVYW